MVKILKNAGRGARAASMIFLDGAGCQLRRRRPPALAAFDRPLHPASAGSLKVTEKLFGTWVNLGESGPARYIWTDNGVGRQFARSHESNDAGIGLRFDGAMRLSG
jgi:hypothetical protein